MHLSTCHPRNLGWAFHLHAAIHHTMKIPRLWTLRWRSSIWRYIQCRSRVSFPILFPPIRLYQLEKQWRAHCNSLDQHHSGTECSSSNMFVAPMIGVIPTEIYGRPRGPSFTRPEQASRSSTSSDASSLHRASSSSSSSTSASSVASDTQGRSHRRSLSGGNFHLPRVFQPFHKKARSQPHSEPHSQPQTKPRSQSQSQSQSQSRSKSQSQSQSQSQPKSKPKPPSQSSTRLQKPNPKPHSRPPLSHRYLPITTPPRASHHDSRRHDHDGRHKSNYHGSIQMLYARL
ncbi:hypothetical protein GQ44DRAFT_69303 [Phaeosphaeriaceae sp. PMI808]|nr:hypothetical protein GQ44DRAFT_69303 [Phaeosphaeriaceae sp. PMI808]